MATTAEHNDGGERKETKLAAPMDARIDAVDASTYWVLSLPGGSRRHVVGWRADVARYAACLAKCYDIVPPQRSVVVERVDSSAATTTTAATLTVEARATAVPIDAAHVDALAQRHAQLLARAFRDDCAEWEAEAAQRLKAYRLAELDRLVRERETKAVAEKKRQDEAREEAIRVYYERQAAELAARLAADQEMRRWLRLPSDAPEVRDYEQQRAASEDAERRAWERRARESHHEWTVANWRVACRRSEETWKAWCAAVGGTAAAADATGFARVVRIIRCTPVSLGPADRSLDCVDVSICPSPETASTPIASASTPIASASSPASSSSSTFDPPANDAAFAYSMQRPGAFRAGDRAILFSHATRDFKLPADLAASRDIVPDLCVQSTASLGRARRDPVGGASLLTMGALAPLAWMTDNQVYFFGFKAREIVAHLDVAHGLAPVLGGVVCEYLGRPRFAIGDDLTRVVWHERQPEFRFCDCRNCVENRDDPRFAKPLEYNDVV